MKKRVIFGIAMAFVALCLIGCGGDEDDYTGPDAVTPSGWTTGVGLTLTTGNNPGELKYEVTATNPAADSYTLYYVSGSKDSSADIITGSSITFTSVLTGTISGVQDATYSAVVVAKKDGLNDARSALKEGKTKKAMILTVTGDIPTDIVGVSLLNDSFLPVAAGPIGANGVVMLMDYPALTSYWKTAGSYYIAAGTSMDGSGTNYTYSTDGSNPAKFTITIDGSNSVAWDDFAVQGGGGEDKIILTVENIPGGTTILAAILYAEMPTSAETPRAGTAMNSGGTFTFNNIDLDEYYIILASGIDSSSPQYIYCEEMMPTVKMPAKYDFTDEDEVTLDWSDFVDVATLIPGGGLTLTITGIPPETGIIGGALLDDSQQMVAIGIMGAGGVVSFVAPDMSSPFTTTGEYYVALADSMEGTGNNYLYFETVNMGVEIKIPKKFDITEGDNTLTWEEFELEENVVTGP